MRPEHSVRPMTPLVLAVLAIGSPQFLRAAVTIRPVVWFGDTLPTGDTLTGILSYYLPVINNNGRVAFGARIQPDEGDPRVAIIAERAGGVEIAAATGDAVPEAGPGRVLTSFDYPLVWNDADQVFFSGSFTDTADPRGRRMDGLWVTEQGALKAIAIEGHPAPDTPDGV